jgi:hypothetical protein
MNSLLKVRKLIKIFIWWFWDVCSMRYEESDLKCGLQEAGSSVMIMRLLTQRHQSDNSWQKQSIPTLPQPPYSWDLSPNDIFLLHKIKVTLKGRRFQTEADNITNTMNDLRVIPQTSFEHCFQKWKRW